MPVIKESRWPLTKLQNPTDMMQINSIAAMLFSHASYNMLLACDR